MDEQRIAREAFARAADLQRQIEERFPGVWDMMDRFRADPPEQWPEWCLLPMAAPAAIVSRGRPGRFIPGGMIAAMSALYAWRYSRSVWIVHPDLMHRLGTTVPDPVEGVPDVALPQWCVFVPTGAREFPGSGLWMHMEWDVNHSRPELRLLIDTNGEAPPWELEGVPIYLDRPTLTEAAADYVASGITWGQRDVRGAALSAAAAEFATQYEWLVALAQYVARPQALIREARVPGLRPVRYRSAPRDRRVWLVGYPD